MSAPFGPDPPRRARGRGAPWWPLYAAGALVLLGALAARAWRGALPHAAPPPSPLAAPVLGAALLAALAWAAWTRTRHLPSRPRSRVGRRAEFPWTPLTLGYAERLRHIHCVGPSGSGKTTSVLAPLLVQDLRAGAGVTVIELKGGELCGAARAWAARLHRPVWEWQPGQADSACWNPLRGADAACAERLVYALQVGRGGASAAADYYAAVAAGVIRHSVAVFASTGTPLDLRALRTFLLDPALRQGMLAGCNDADAIVYFRRVFDAWRPDERLRHLQGLLNDLDGLVGQPLLRRALCPDGQAPGAEIDLARCLETGGILLATLPFGGLLRQADVLGGFLLSGLQAAVYARAPGGPAHFIYLDEFQHFAGPGFSEFLALARGYNVGAVLAHQNLAQLRQAGGVALEETIRANARTTVVLRCDGPDAHTFSRWLPPRPARPWAAADLSGLPFGVAVVQTAGGRRRPRAERVRLRPAPRA